MLWHLLELIVWWTGLCTLCVVACLIADWYIQAGEPVESTITVERREAIRDWADADPEGYEVQMLDRIWEMEPRSGRMA